MHVSTTKIGKEIWYKIFVIYAKTSEVKNCSFYVLMHDYELFSIFLYESISNMFICSTKIFMSLHALGCILVKFEKVSKILHYCLNLRMPT